jgi:H+/Cl- antiporter ClcA
MRSKSFVVLLVVVSIVGVAVSLLAWCFLEGIYQVQREVFTHLPHALGYDNGPPLWWYVPVLGIAGLLVALAITRLPGSGGHLPARGLAAGGPPNVSDLPGVILAGFATIALGLVLGPEAPLIALGSGSAVLIIKLARRDMPSQAVALIAASGAFAAVSFIFSSPLIAAVLMIEVAGLGGARLRMTLLPGLLASGIGALVSIGMGSFTGLSSAAYALAPLKLPAFGHPTIGQFGWTIALAVAIAAVTRLLMLGGMTTFGVVRTRLVPVLPLIGLIIAGLAILFSKTADHSAGNVLFSGQDALPGLVSQAGSWSMSALVLLIACKGIAYSMSLGSFRGGPTFPAMFLGAAAGLMASHLPGFPLEPAVAVGMGAAVASVLRLPLTAIVIATLLTSHSGTGDEPLIIVGVVVAYLITLMLSAPSTADEPEAETAAARGASPDSDDAAARSPA